MLSSDDLWLAYKNTHFRWMDEVLHCEGFAIVTAYNPRSTIRLQKDNERQQHELIRIVVQQEWRYKTLLAGDESFKYFEPSLAIECSVVQAKWLAANFEQNAIYYVQGDRLSLIPV